MNIGVLDQNFGDPRAMVPYCPTPREPGIKGALSKAAGDPTVDIDSAFRSRTDLSTILDRRIKTLARRPQTGWGTDPLITAAVVILFARFLCRLSSYRSVSSTISSEMISYSQRQCDIGGNESYDQPR